MFQEHRRDLGATTNEVDRNGSVFDNIFFKKHLWLDDNGASCHDTNDAAGLFNCRFLHSYLKISSGKHLYSSTIGKKRALIVQVNGSTLDLILHDCMYFLDVYLSCFSITKVLGEGWKSCNHSIHMVLSKFDHHILFYQVLKTTHGSVCNSKMLTSYDTGGTTMELAASDRCSYPFEGEPTSNYLHDKPFTDCDKLFVQTEIAFEFFLINWIAIHMSNNIW